MNSANMCTRVVTGPRLRMSAWIVNRAAMRLPSAVIALGHAAGDEVGAGHMSVDEATTHLRAATFRLLRAQPRENGRPSERPTSEHPTSE